MESVSNRLHAGLTWLTSPGGLLNTTLFDTLAVPFTDASHSGIGAVANDRRASSGGERIVFVDQSGHQMSSAEVEALDRAAFSDSPWGFIASRYALTLGVMAVVVNRITHICRPQGRPRPLPGPRRIAIQLPTMIFLGWSGFLLLLVTLRSFSWGSQSLSMIDNFAWIPVDVRTLIKGDAPETDIHTANSALLWRLFLSVCFAVVSSTLLRTLEGHNTVVNPDDLGNSPTFNLVGFAVLLHLHASSYTFPPNKHVYLSILFQVGEVLGLQACTCWTTPPISRLTLTTAFGFTSTIHYLLAIRSGDRGYPFLQSFSRAPDVALIAIILLTLFLHALTAVITNTPLSFSRLIDPRSLPLPSDDYNLALFKVGTACLSSTRLSGLDADLIDVSTSTDAWIEVDGGQIRIRSADGSLATPDVAGSGFSNEIRRIRASKAHTQARHPFRSAAWQERWRFLVVFMRTLQGLAIWCTRKLTAALPFDLPRVSSPRWIRQLPRWIRLAWHGRNGEERRRRRLEEQRRQDDRRQQAVANRAERDRLEGAGRALGSSSSTATAYGASGLRRREYTGSPDNVNVSPNSWHRYFQQEFGDDDDDDEWREDGEEEEEDDAGHALTSRQATPTPFMHRPDDYWHQLGGGSKLTDEGQSRDDDDDDDEEEEDDDADGWYDEVHRGDVSAELLTLARRDFDDERGESSSAAARNTYAQILMAHMASSKNRMLTRRGYRDLVGLANRENEDARMLADVIRQRRGDAISRSSSSVSSERERMRLCVICYVEDRTIICWPCKCLALCDACREAMAARPPPRSGHRGDAGHLDSPTTATHTCPTCRTPVIGFSRIFMP